MFYSAVLWEVHVWWEAVPWEAHVWFGTRRGSMVNNRLLGRRSSRPGTPPEWCKLRCKVPSLSQLESHDPPSSMLRISLSCLWKPFSSQTCGALLSGSPLCTPRARHQKSHLLLCGTSGGMLSTLAPKKLRNLGNEAVEGEDETWGKHSMCAKVYVNWEEETILIWHTSLDLRNGEALLDPFLNVPNGNKNGWWHLKASPENFSSCCCAILHPYHHKYVVAPQTIHSSRLLLIHWSNHCCCTLG